MTLPTLEQAHHLAVDLAGELRQLNLYGKNSFGHYLCVAKHARGIAEKLPHLNPDKAYVMGLLHDYGQVDEARDHHNFHGLIGYQKLMTLGYDEAARAALVHSFFEWEDITPERYHSYDRDCILKCAELLKERPFDDYDRLVHLADLMVTYYKPTTIEMRFEYLAATYRINEKMIKEKYAMACRLKRYFDDLCHENVYDILGIQRLKNNLE
jgi:hypothetical protein